MTIHPSIHPSPHPLIQISIDSDWPVQPLWTTCQCPCQCSGALECPCQCPCQCLCQCPCHCPESVAADDDDDDEVNQCALISQINVLWSVKSMCSDQSNLSRMNLGHQRRTWSTPFHSSALLCTPVQSLPCPALHIHIYPLSLSLQIPVSVAFFIYVYMHQNHMA
jgi:hypothetical protein